MSEDRYEDSSPEVVVIDGYILKDICWLLTAVEAFARCVRRRIETAS